MGTAVRMTEVLEGEVIDTHRKRERNNVRSIGGLEVLPPDVETKVVALRGLPVESQVSAVTAMLAHSKAGLMTAIAAQDLPTIRDWKAKAGAVQKMAQQLQLGKDLQLDAAEFVRRAERGLGLAIREGQQRGEILPPHVRSDRPGQGRDVNTTLSDIVSADEWRGNGAGIKHITDGISDDVFEQALAEARNEEKLSRANVARKARSKTKPVIDENDPLIDAEVEPAPPPKISAPKHNSTEMVQNISGMLQSIVQTLGYIEPSEVDRSVANSVLPQISTALKAIRKTAKGIQNG